jgi:NADPH:quinone reductase
MRALICTQYAGIESLEVGEVSEPAVGVDDALIEVEAAAVNFADTLIVAGLYQLKPDLPFVPGLEFSGVVTDGDETGRWSRGDRVAGFVNWGAMAESVAAPASSLVRLPDSIPFDVGAAVPVAYGTSYHALIDRGHLSTGETLLVLGGAGGVGIAAIQIGKIVGATVIAAVSSHEKEQVALDAGADRVIRYDQTPLRDGIAAATGDAGVDVVFDPVGGDATEAALRSTRWNGRLLVIGFTAGSIPRIPLNLTLVKGTSVVGVFWGRFASEEPDKCAENSDLLMDWVDAGKLKPIVQRVFPLDEAVDALRWIAERRVIGRVVITP